GIEAAYVGGAGSITGLGLQDGSVLMRNGAETTLRLNAPLMLGRTLFEPYLYGGVGWDRYTVTPTTRTANVDASSHVLTTPFGVGFDTTYRGSVADVRVAYRPTFKSTLTNMPVHDNLTNWTLGAQLGYEF